MAKGPSKSTADVNGRSGGCVGEYRRSGGRPLWGGTTGTEDPTHAVPGGLYDPPGTYGEPVAVKVARRVREAVRGNGPVERPEPRPGPTTSQHKATAPSAAAAPATSGSALPRAGPRPDSASTGLRRADQRIRTRGLNRWSQATAEFWNPTGSSFDNPDHPHPDPGTARQRDSGTLHWHPAT